ncbi:MAG: hypothetical protein IKN89_12530 [Oscillospiraceae bacterium]|nr:hypothetical protein [Oscillospiraceae bacterium]
MKTKVLILLFLICLFSLAGCGGSGRTGTVEPSGAAAPTAAAPPAAKTHLSPAEQAAIREAVLAHNRISHVSGEFSCESHILLAAETRSDGAEEGDRVTYYLMALYQAYDQTKDGPKVVSGSSMPIALTFAVHENGEGYTLLEYWEPQGGNRYMERLRAKFPASVPDEDLDTQKYIAQLTEDCDAQAEAFFAYGGD